MKTSRQPEKLRCEQCGRVGTRGFRRLFAEHKVGEPPEMILCVATKACRKRWERGNWWMDAE